MSQTSGQTEKSEARSVENLVADLKSWLQELERHIAGYSGLSRALATHDGSLPGGARKAGLPILTFKCTADGHNPVDVHFDLKKVAPEHVANVLLPLIHSQIPAVFAALNGLEFSVQELRAVLSISNDDDDERVPVPVRSKLPKPKVPKSPQIVRADEDDADEDELFDGDE